MRFGKILFIVVLCLAYLFSCQAQKPTLAEALLLKEKAIKKNKGVVYYIYSSEALKQIEHYPNYRTKDQIFDSLIVQGDILKGVKKYVFIPVDIDDSTTYKILPRWKLDIFTPTIAVFDSDENPLSLFVISINENDGPLNLSDEINYNIKLQSELSETIKKFNIPFKKGILKLQELYSLIDAYNEMRLQCEGEIEKYCEMGGEINLHLLHLASNYRIKSNSCIAKKILGQTNNNDFDFEKQRFYNQMMIYALNNKDSSEFEAYARYLDILLQQKEKEYNNLSLKEKKSMNALNSIFFSNKLNQVLNINQNRVMLYGDLYDDEKVIKYGKIVMDILYNEFEKQKNKLLKIENYVSYITSVVWAYQKCVNDVENLKKALQFVDFGLKLTDKEPYLLDASAHLYYKLGNIDKAIELESKAINEVQNQNEGFYRIKYQEMIDTLEEFKKSKK
jgi:hypothetical protein